MVDTAEEAPAANGGGEQRPSQRITPYLKAGSRPGSAVTPCSAGKPLTPASSGKFAERQQAGTVVATLNQQIEATAQCEAMELDASTSGRPGGCELRILGAPLSHDERYMVDRIEDRVAYCERRILALSAEVPSAADGEAAEGEPGLHPVGLACQQPAIFAGRIVCDTEEGRLNAASLLLEGSQQHSEGMRVRLDVSKCAAGVRLFPGQTVLVQGTNPSGHCVVASEVLPGMPAPMPATPLPELAAAVAAHGGRGLSVVVAAGPYTLADDLAYEPLAALLDYCRAQRPNVLLLAGPFVDDQHPRVADGQLDVLFEELYQSAVVEPIRAFVASAEGAGTRVLLLPAVRDAHHHPVFPQPPLDEVAGAPAVTPLANPTTLALDEVVLGVSSADWLLGVTSQELAEGPAAAGDRMAALAGHLLSQRSYFPMFPMPLGACFDSTKSHALEMPLTPDLLITPSQLAPFAKLVPVARGGLEGPPQLAGNVVCINPGRLAKGSSGEAAVPGGGPSLPLPLMHPCQFALPVVPYRFAGPPLPGSQVAPLHMCILRRTRRQQKLRPVEQRPPMRRCPTVWMSAAAWRSDASERGSSGMHWFAWSTIH